MKKFLVIIIATFGFAMQSCSSYPEMSSKIVTQTGFSNDGTIKFESKEREFFCDFQWTPGYKTWDYNIFTDDSLGNLGENGAKELWCLIPDSTSTLFSISLERWNDGETHYICRNEISYTIIMNESSEKISIYDDSANVERIMKCASLNNKNNNQIRIGRDGNNNEKLGTLSQNSRIYHVIKRKDSYSIAGHLSIKHVKHVTLSVLIAFIDAEGFKNNLENNKTKMVDSLKSYLEKAGFKLNINPNDIVYERDLNNLYNNRYDYVIGVKYNAKKGEMIYNDFNISVISDDNKFFGSANPGEKARLLAALLYSKILGKNPIDEKDQNDFWLSYYTKNMDFSQPSKDWELGRSSSIPFKYQLEYTSIMQYFKGE
ncbi:MAG: hypothetical protein LBC87_06755 [Fibromonadaceae bacterium]|jgi:hypothetical protein|nr:hypothetical protein [Fibromonadaceae bacterium]